MHYMWTSGRLLAMEDEEDGVAGLSQHMYLGESSAEMSAEFKRQLGTPR